MIFFFFCFSESVVNYITPRADTEFEDVSYDGDLGRTYMTGGLGMLTDSLYGADDFLQFDLQLHKPLSTLRLLTVFVYRILKHVFKSANNS